VRRLADREAQALVHGDRLDSSISIWTFVTGITISVPSGRLANRSRRWCGVELRAVAREERRVTAALFLLEDVHLGLEPRVRRDRTRLAENLAALDLLALGAAEQAADVVASLTLVGIFLNISTPVTTVVVVVLMPTISTVSPVLMMPCSTRPVATVPRPVIEKTSSTGIRNGLSSSRVGSGM